jgi:hypothetical protein
MERARTSVFLVVLVVSVLFLRGASVVNAEPSAQSTPALGQPSLSAKTARAGGQTAAPSKDFWQQWAPAIQGISAIGMLILTGALVINSNRQWKAINQQIAVTAQHPKLF